MSNNKRNFIRGECERCGAPLTRAKQKGKYICQYCGASYYDPNYSGGEWEADIEVKELPEKIKVEPIVQPLQIPKSKRKINAIKIIGIGVFAVLCLIVFFVMSLGTDKRTTTSNISQSLNKPEMLTQLPQAVRAGDSVAFANWELTLSPEIDVDDNRISFSLILQNWDDNQQTFRYKPNTIIVYDDLGNKYPFYLGNCEPDIPYLDRQITFEPYDEVEFESSRSWCSRANNLPLYSGVIPQEAKYLYFYFESFGVYQNITFVIDL